MLNNVVLKGGLKPISIKDVVISHLSYADDLLIFTEAEQSSINSLGKVLQDFANCSGLKVNNDKSHFFSRKVDLSWVKKNLNIKHVNLPVRYIGLPLFSGKLTKQMCCPLIDKVKLHLGWKANVYLWQVDLN